LVGVFVLFVGSADSADDRRGRREPGMILETGGRTGACDVLRFTKDGTTLLAVGDDRVARSWRLTDNNELQPLEPLRWSVWRNMRGVMYALALTPDETKIAVAGCGVRDGSVAVIDRASGAVLGGLRFDGSETVRTTVWALAFSPSGKQVAVGALNGDIWLWPWEVQPTKLTKLGSHGSNARHLRFTDEDTLISIAADGPAIEWHRGEKRREIPLFRVNHREQVVASADGQWLACVSRNREVPLEVVSADGQSHFAPRLQVAEEAQGIALSRDGSSVAAACRTVPKDGPFVREVSARVVIYDRRGSALHQRTEFPIPLIAERVAWHPDGRRVAVAGGEDHEITLWDVASTPPKQLTKAVGVGKCLWSVAFAKDGSSFGWKDRYQPAPNHPNQRGAGPWRVFDFQKRTILPDTQFQPLLPIETQAGWSVRPKPDKAYEWDVVGPDGQIRPLPWDWMIDDRPRCYTFLPEWEGQPPRLAVGHYWGLSVFELQITGIKRLWLGQGHQGYVSSIAPSADGKLLLTASRDQTIACWAADPGPNYFGAEFRAGLGRVFVNSVRAGSPAWEAGLARGDEILVCAYDGGRYLFDPDRREKRANATNDAEECLRVIAAAQPSKELYFRIRRDGREEQLASSFRHRPLWCFLPTRTNDWVLWRYFDYIYDASPGGDAYIGWQIGGDVHETPDFYRAQGFAKASQFNRPDKITQLLTEGRYDPERVRLPDLEPPQLTMKLHAVESDKVKVDLRAEPRGDRDVFQVESAVLWINDYRWHTWRQPGKILERLEIPLAEFRPGTNRLSWHVTSRAGTSDRKQLLIERPPDDTPPRRFALVAGVADYRSTVPRPGERHTPWANLDSLRTDLVRMESLLTRNGYDVTALEDSRATPEAIKTALSSFAEKLRPNDVFVLYLAGHGWVEQHGEKAGTFVFVGPKFDFAKPSETGLPTDELNDHLARIRGRKVVLLMTCHSGDVVRGSLRDPVRELTPGGVGPVVIAACAARESALVHPSAGSLFAVALRAEAQTKPRMTAAELAEAIQTRVPRILAEWKQADLAEPDKDKRLLPPDLVDVLQLPTIFAPDPEVARTIILGK
jgi:WD40 repeat protein